MNLNEINNVNSFSMSDKRYINVPENIRYISDWIDIINILPRNQHYILNKIVTGCGFTEYFLNNEIPIILCSPRKILLENKHEQHKTKGRPTYLVINKLEKNVGVDRDNTQKSVEEKYEELPENEVISLKSEITAYITNTFISGMIPKILVTYDSLKHVLEAIGYDNLYRFQVVVDEFQSIFMDSNFKASTELEFVNYLQYAPNVCYLSATPMMESYLSVMKEFKNLPYYQLVWPESMISNPLLYWKPVRSLVSACDDLIQDYKNGRFKTNVINGQIVESKEIVFYVNSINEIKKIVSKSGLTSKDTDIICSNTKKNVAKLKKMGFNVAKVPLEDEPRKMFTFCTRTVYLGADFYSPDAYTVVISNSNNECMAIDIALDLPQILGRQRLDENVFRNEAIIFYKTTDKIMSEAEIVHWVTEREKRTESLINTWKTLPNKTDQNILLSKYRESLYKSDYVGITLDNNREPVAVENVLVKLSEIRAWHIRNKDYADNISVLNGLKANGFRVENYKTEIDSFMVDFLKDKNFIRRMKLYCDFADKNSNIGLLNISKIPKEFHNYFNLFGSQRIKALNYQESNLKKEMDNLKTQQQFENSGLTIFDSFFTVGKKYTKKEIKEILQQFYNTFGMSQTAKASDINQYYETKRAKIPTGITGKYDEGLELLKLKDNLL